jgi:hypothetical protein
MDHKKLGSDGLLGLRWVVTLSNRSENRLSLVDGRVSSVNNQGAISWTSGFTSVENIDGTPFNSPVALNGGEAKQFLVRAPVQVPASVVQVLDDLPGTNGKPLAGMSLNQVGFALARRRLDYLGDSIDVDLDGRKIVGWQLKPPYKSTTNVWEIQTGRGAKFIAFLVWPPSQ